MTKKLIYQINVPNHIATKKLSTYTFIEDMYEISERNAKNYASKCGADYYKVTVADDFKLASGKHLDYQKLKVYDFLDYDCIVYFDSDYIIKNNAPNIFDVCGNNFSAAREESEAAKKLAEDLGMIQERYFNAGLIYFVKDVLLKTKDYLPEYLSKNYKYDGQGLLNKLFYDRGIPFKELPSKQWNPAESCFGEFADHYAGRNKTKWGETNY